MSFRQSSEETRWAVISKYKELKSQNPHVSPLQVYNKLRFSGYFRIKELFVRRTIERFNSTNRVADRLQVNKKRKFDDSVRQSVVKYASNQKKPKYTQVVFQKANGWHASSC